MSTFLDLCENDTQRNLLTKAFEAFHLAMLSGDIPYTEDDRNEWPNLLEKAGLEPDRPPQAVVRDPPE